MRAAWYALAMADKRTPSLDDLKTLRDEIRVKIHLAEMSAREFWGDLEPKLADLEDKLERGSGKAAKVASIFLDEMTSAFRRLRDRLDDDKADAGKPEDKPEVTPDETGGGDPQP